MSKASVLVVDDEPLARRRLVRMLAKLDWVGTIGEATNAAEAIRAVPELTPDILLLDIQMPGGSGFDVLERRGEGSTGTALLAVDYDSDDTRPVILKVARNDAAGERLAVEAEVLVPLDEGQPVLGPDDGGVVVRAVDGVVLVVSHGILRVGVGWCYQRYLMTLARVKCF